jgi:hypothetical protein
MSETTIKQLPRAINVPTSDGLSIKSPIGSFINGLVKQLKKLNKKNPVELSDGSLLSDMDDDSLENVVKEVAACAYNNKELPEHYDNKVLVEIYDMAASTLEAHRELDKAEKASKDSEKNAKKAEKEAAKKEEEEAVQYAADSQKLIEEYLDTVADKIANSAKNIAEGNLKAFGKMLPDSIIMTGNTVSIGEEASQKDIAAMMQAVMASNAGLASAETSVMFMLGDMLNQVTAPRGNKGPMFLTQSAAADFISNQAAKNGRNVTSVYLKALALTSAQVAPEKRNASQPISYYIKASQAKLPSLKASGKPEEEYKLMKVDEMQTEFRASLIDAVCNGEIKALNEIENKVTAFREEKGFKGPKAVDRGEMRRKMHQATILMYVLGNMLNENDEVTLAVNETQTATRVYTKVELEEIIGDLYLDIIPFILPDIEMIKAGQREVTKTEGRGKDKKTVTTTQPYYLVDPMATDNAAAEATATEGATGQSGDSEDIPLPTEE